MHLLYDKQVELYGTTLLLFCKFEKIENLTTDSRLVGYKYNEPKNHLDKSEMQIGYKATELLKKMPKDDKELFLFEVK